MFFKRFILNTIGGIALFNGLTFLTATINHTAFRFDCLLGLIMPILFGWISTMVPGPKKQI